MGSKEVFEKRLKFGVLEAKNDMLEHLENSVMFGQSKI
jgi:hypothetical protein